jgi:hypothetical protein
MRRLTPLAITTYLCAVACVVEDEPPDSPLPLDWHGQRVWFGTDVVDEVCAGTVPSLDAHVNSIESELDLGTTDDVISFWLLGDETFGWWCNASKYAACAHGHRVYSSTDGWLSRRHELVHARLSALEVNRHRVFREGIAAALDQDGGCLSLAECRVLELDDLLSNTLDSAGYTAAADLVHGMLNDFGPAAVLEFMAAVDNELTPDQLRAVYEQHFNRTLDEDFIGYMRGLHDDYTPAQMNCSLPPAPSVAGAVQIDMSMDCSVASVRNEFVGLSPRGIIEWSFVVTPEQAGAFTLTASPSERLTVSRCSPPHAPRIADFERVADLGPWTRAKPLSHGADPETLLLGPGLHRIMWIAAFGDQLTLAIVPPCTYERQDCATNEQCTIWNECEPVVSTPAALGEPCSQEIDAPLVCEAGARCMGNTCVAECDATQGCADGLACSRVRTCGPSCDLLAQDCGAGQTCLPSSDPDQTRAGVGVCVAAGSTELLTACERDANSCQTGAVCDWVNPNAYLECMLDFEGGCCVPLCDPAATDGGCPAELPRCAAILDGPAGVCRAAGP